VFEINDQDDDMKTKDQMDPTAAMALLDVIKAYAYADSPESADAAMQAIAAALELDMEMVKQHLSGGEMMEMDGIKLMLSKDAAAKLRAAQAKMKGDSAQVLADAQGQITALKRSVDSSRPTSAIWSERSPRCVRSWSRRGRPASAQTR
jgi:hypothetical protein